MHGRRPEEERYTLEALDAHSSILRSAESGAHCGRDLTAEERQQLTGLMTRVKTTLQALAEHDPRARANGSDETRDEEAHAP